MNDFNGHCTRPFTVEELKLFFDSFNSDSREELRTRLYFFIQFYLGLRKNSVDKFNLNNIIWSKRLYKVVNDKGKDRYSNKGRRVIPIPYELFYYLRQHYESDWVDIKLHNGYFFYTSKSNIPSPTKYNKEFRKHIRLAGLEEAYALGRFTLVTHSFRKSYATLLLENGCDLFTLMELLGHTSILATQRYLRLVLKRKIDIIARTFEGKVVFNEIKPLVLLEETPSVETSESFVNVSITREQYNILSKLGVLEKSLYRNDIEYSVT